MSLRLKSWHDPGSARARISTTVDAELLREVRRVRSGISDSVLVDEALRALLAHHRAAAIDAAYAAYDAQPLDDPDEWGDLASFSDATERS